MKMKKFFGYNYSKSWKFARECRWFFVFVFGVFAFAFLIGFAFPVFFRSEIIELIKTLMLEIEGRGSIGLIGFIFLNNLKASFVAMASGIGFGVLPVISCIVNGYLLGFVAREAASAGGIFTMWRIFPHGIFELPAVLFSIGIGVRLGFEIGRSVVRRFENSDYNGRVEYVFFEGLRFFVFVVFPLLLIAGIIEGILISFVG